MRAGQMRERVTIQACTETRDVYGQAIVTWTDVATVWAAVESVSGREYLAAAAEQAAVTLKVIIRRRNDLLPTHRLLWRGETLEIHAWLPYGARDFGVLMCSAGTNEG